MVRGLSVLFFVTYIFLFYLQDRKAFNRSINQFINAVKENNLEYVMVNLNNNFDPNSRETDLVIYNYFSFVYQMISYCIFCCAFLGEITYHVRYRKRKY